MQITSHLVVYCRNFSFFLLFPSKSFLKAVAHTLMNACLQCMRSTMQQVEMQSCACIIPGLRDFFFTLTFIQYGATMGTYRTFVVD